MLVADLALKEFHPDARMDYHALVSVASGGGTWHLLAGLLAAIAEKQGCFDASEHYLLAVNALRE
eukprot:11216310-Lingulodinium_polyedra.AAC.1